jgi:hypothetical protein
MGTVRSYKTVGDQQPSIFAMLVDDINKMSEAEQKVLWLRLNKERLSTLTKAIDKGTANHNLSDQEIDTLISEAKKYVRGKKKS